MNASKAAKASPPRSLSVKESDEQKQLMHGAIHKQLAIATELQAHGDFDGALTLIKGVVETSSHYGIDIVKLILSYPISIIASSILLGDTQTFNYLSKNKIAKDDISNPDVLLVLIHRKDIKNTKYVLRSGKAPLINTFFGSGNSERGNYELRGADRAVAAALVDTNDKKFLIEVLGNVHQAAKLALMMGKPAFAREILISIEHVDRDLSTPLPAQLLPPPAYAPTENLIDL